MGEREATTSQIAFPLWSDEPSEVDLLAFGAVAATVTDALFDPLLDPVALGLSGSWGSGKTTVLKLVARELSDRSTDDEKVLVISTEPWRYDPATGPKESLIAEILAAISEEIDETKSVGKVAKEKLLALAKRVNWAKALKMAVSTSVTLQLPKAEDLFDLVKEKEADDLHGERGLAQFRDEFAALLSSKGLKHIKQVVVLVDDLDRCLPETVVETLEAIRLFLAVNKMSFVIAADEARVAEAIEQRLKIDSVSESGEKFSTLYLHKIVQTTIPVPALSRFDTQSYLFLLLARPQIHADQFTKLVDACDEARSVSGGFRELAIPEGVDLAASLAMADRLTPIIYERFRGNPRRIKRFLNDMNVRQSVAARRGITLPAEAIAKLMVLERLLPDDFETVLAWLANDSLQERLQELDQVGALDEEGGAETDGEFVVSEKTAQAPPAEELEGEAPADETTPDAITPSASPFTDGLEMWAQLPPKMGSLEVTSYLHLAAAFNNVPLSEAGLPERLREIATNLSSSTRLDRLDVTDDIISALTPADADVLITHLGRAARDRPETQQYVAAGILRIAGLHASGVPASARVFRQLPASDVTVATVLLFKEENHDVYGPVLDAWKSGGASSQAIELEGRLGESRM